MIPQRKTKNKALFAALVLVFTLPIPVLSAGILISEIMYDLEGSDSKREWIEIENTSGSSIDISGWKFFESGSNHGLTLQNGSESISAGGFAIIADDSSTFSSDWPSFSGNLFDSSFSLSNTGETIVIRDADLNDIDSVSYSSDWGALGDGKSLQRVSGDWIALTPTPGSANSSSGGAAGGETPPAAEPPGLTFIEDTGSISADAGTDRKVIVGADTLFEGTALGIVGEPLESARYLWSFGDGSTGEGKHILHAFQHPGTYVVVLNVSSGKYSASDRIRVKAESSSLSVFSANDSFVEIENKSSSDIDISWWILRAGGRDFLIPRDTIIAGATKTSFPADITGLNVTEGERVFLLYPNGTVADELGDELYKKLFEGRVINTPEANPGAVTIMPNQEDSSLDDKEEDLIVAQAGSLFDESPKENEDKNSVLLKWLSILAGVIALSVFALFLIKGPAPDTTISGREAGTFSEKVREMADEIDIIGEYDENQGTKT